MVSIGSRLMRIAFPRNWTWSALPSVHPVLLCLIVSVALVALYNNSLWSFTFSKWDGRSLRDYLFLLSIGAVLASAFTLVSLLFSSSRTVKPALVFLVFFSGTVSYFSSNYGIVFDKTMILNITGTDVGEASDFLSTELISHLLLYGAVPSWLIVTTPIKVFTWKKEGIIRLATAMGCLLLISVTAASFYQEYASFVRNNRQIRYTINPTSPIYYTFRALAPSIGNVDETYRQVAMSAARDVSNDDRPMVFVLVVGETARADRFSINGYNRQTNPSLSALPIVSFGNVVSCGTSTAVSVPCLFSAEARSEFSVDEAKWRENLLDILVRAKFDVMWLENNTGCKGVCARVPTERMTPEKFPEFCKDQSCNDEALVESLKTKLEEITTDTVIVMHQIGSHGPAYYRRYPEAYRKFFPTCDTTQIQLCTQEQISNSYDNSILYTDQVISQIVHELQTSSDKLDASMLYVSDHGESLGERGMYLHGMPYAFSPAEQREVPMILWLGTEFAQRQEIDSGCIRDIAERPFSHDNIFHTVLGMLKVETDVYEGSLDFAEPCMQVTPKLPLVADRQTANHSE
ncbi:phosphoethanolamine transferase EptA [Rhodobiaceae bacterium]|nr:phosphoethanolamine transferase EptA [Rhodobiaceae bacterium]